MDNSSFGWTSTTPGHAADVRFGELRLRPRLDLDPDGRIVGLF